MWFSKQGTHAMRSVFTIYLSIIGGILSKKEVKFGPQTERPIKCLRYPLKPFPDPCTIKNLVVRDRNGELLVDDKTCGNAVNSSHLDLNRPPIIAFAKWPYPYAFYWSTYLLAVVDKSNGQLIELATNVSLDWKNFGTVLRPPTTTEAPFIFWGVPIPTRKPRVKTRTWWQLKEYDKPVFNHSHHIHELHYWVYIQEHHELPYQPTFKHDKNLDTPFDFHGWLSRLVKAGKLFCGPLAGARVLLYDETYGRPPSTIFPEHDPVNEDTAHRASCNASLLSIIMVAVLFWQTRQ